MAVHTTEKICGKSLLGYIWPVAIYEATEKVRLEKKRIKSYKVADKLEGRPARHCRPPPLDAPSTTRSLRLERQSWPTLHQPQQWTMPKSMQLRNVHRKEVRSESKPLKLGTASLARLE